MAGSFINIRLEGDGVSQAINRLLESGRNLEPALREIGEQLLLSHHDRWATGTAPDGTPWAPKSEMTQERSRQPGNVLRENDILRDTLTYQLQGTNTLLFGSSMVYAAMHQFGGVTSPKSMIPNKAIPARPYLGLSESDEGEALAVLRDHLANSLTA